MAIDHVSQKSLQDYPKFQPVDASLLRRIRHVVLKVLCDMWVSAFSLFGKVTTEYKREDAAFRGLKNTFDRLSHTRCLGTSAVSAYGRYLERQNPQLQFVESKVGGDRDLPNLQEQKTQIAIPVVLKGCLRDHIVSIFVDTVSNRIEYYDSKGLTIQDRNDPMLNHVLLEVLEKYGNKETSVIENREKHQYDSHNCGVYVLDYFYRRTSESTESIFAKGRGPRAANQELRARMIHQLATPSE